MIILIPLLMAIAPAALLLIYFYKQDNAKPEPKKLVLKIFFLGILSIIPAIILELIVSRFHFIFQFPWLLYFAFDAFIVAALSEEFIKMTVVRKFAFTNSAIDEDVKMGRVKGIDYISLSKDINNKIKKVGSYE
ncbi:MAG: PrsW family glutamic-type intramembrane protease [Spirochaetaceae bacterium]|nr:PrsW family glutamic-type intramembrane protease [Spirochaetaceae bacterium]